jgi:hypothetical protein
MAVSKHNQWKRQKNGLMKLVRSHSEWLEKRRERKMRELSRKRGDMPIESSQWWDKSTRTKPVVSGIETHAHGSSTKRTQVGKKI